MEFGNFGWNYVDEVCLVRLRYIMWSYMWLWLLMPWWYDDALEICLSWYMLEEWLRLNCGWNHVNGEYDIDYVQWCLIGNSVVEIWHEKEYMICKCVWVWESVNVRVEEAWCWFWYILIGFKKGWNWHVLVDFEKSWKWLVLKMAPSGFVWKHGFWAYFDGT